jgi:hypothetical protein
LQKEVVNLAISVSTFIPPRQLQAPAMVDPRLVVVRDLLNQVEAVIEAVVVAGLGLGLALGLVDLLRNLRNQSLSDTIAVVAKDIGVERDRKALLLLL